MKCIQLITSCLSCEEIKKKMRHEAFIWLYGQFQKTVEMVRHFQKQVTNKFKSNLTLSSTFTIQNTANIAIYFIKMVLVLHRLIKKIISKMCALLEFYMLFAIVSTKYAPIHCIKFLSFAENWYFCYLLVCKFHCVVLLY